MLTRREVLRYVAGLGGLLAAHPLLAGCHTSGTTYGGSMVRGAVGADLVASDIAREPGGDAELRSATQSLQHFSADLYRRIAAETGESGDVVCSPYSVMVALAMTRNGAAGETAAEMDRVLHAPSLHDLNSGLNALTRLVESRADTRERADGTEATVSLDVANSLWGQHDTGWLEGFLDALARHYGAGMRLVDYRRQTEAARVRINAWTAGQTHDRIPELVGRGVLDALTRLVLVNAIYLKAPWEETFVPSMTRTGPFRTADGRRVDVDMMSGEFGRAGFASGDGWQAARLAYAGGQLAMTIVVPDGVPLADLEQSLDGERLGQVVDSPQPVHTLQLELPRWRFRLQAKLKDHLAALGLPTAFDEVRADFSAMTTEERLYVSHVLHEAFVAVDEDGTEAAAATAVVMRKVSMGPPPVVLAADRAFLFVIHDVATGAPLFIGRVDDPST